MTNTQARLSAADLNGLLVVTLMAKRFNTIDALPDWAKPTIQKMIDKGLLNGNGESLDLSLDMLRIFVVNDRAGLY